MTAEERMAYFHGEKHRNRNYNIESKERNIEPLIFKIKFFIALLLFVCFLSLDYTNYKVYEIGSEEIVREVTTDFDFSKIGTL